MTVTPTAAATSTATSFRAIMAVATPDARTADTPPTAGPPVGNSNATAVAPSPGGTATATAAAGSPRPARPGLHWGIAPPAVPRCPVPAPPAFRRADESPDPLFYQQPRFVTHIDDAAIAAVTALYRRLLPAGGRVLDLMSSWVSHLPPEVAYSYVAGLGVNAVELAANPRLSEWVVHDLNSDPRLPFPDASFDAAVCCVSVDYLARPAAVLADLGRVVRPGGVFIATFSNRCFLTKVVAGWLDRDDSGRRRWVADHLRAAGAWEAVDSFDCSPPGGGDPLSAVTARRAVTPPTQ